MVDLIPNASVEAPSDSDLEGAVERLQSIEDNVCRVLRGKRDVVRLTVVALAARGHVLIEDVPGVGKTTLAQSLARSLNLSFQRVQFTSDLLPSDILGVSVYRRSKEAFEFVPGPIFANVVVADEINRATPKTQSALLEAMAEGTVSVDRQRYSLPQPFLVLATQNPLEHQGTFPLPESQLDRFMMSLEIGYPEPTEEASLLLSGGVEEALETLEPVIDGEELIRLQDTVRRVHVEPKVATYMVEIAQATRQVGQLSLGVSTRGAQALYRASQAAALLEGRDFVVPDDVLRLAPAVISHRVSFKRPMEADAARRFIHKLTSSVSVPL